jgi:hypothetical protein
LCGLISFIALILHLPAWGAEALVVVDTKEASSPTMMMEQIEMIPIRVNIEALVKLGLVHPVAGGGCAVSTSKMNARRKAW